MEHRKNIKGDKIGDLPDPYGLRDDKGCCYNNIHELYRGFLFRLCGCGQSEELYNFCVDILTNLELFKEKPYETVIFIVNYFNHIKLMEHGSGIRACWLTEKGKVRCNNDDFISIILKAFLPDENGNYEINGMDGVDRAMDIIKNNYDDTKKLLIYIFQDLELLYVENKLTKDGKRICDLGYRKLPEY